jgi:hypothetical protein
VIKSFIEYHIDKGNTDVRLKFMIFVVVPC